MKKGTPIVPSRISTRRSVSIPSSRSLCQPRPGASEGCDFDLAIEDLSTAIRLDPKFVAGFSDRGVTYMLKGDPNRAITDYNEAIRLVAKTFFARGRAFQELGDLAHAIPDFGEAVRLRPEQRLSGAVALSRAQTRRRPARGVGARRQRQAAQASRLAVSGRRALSGATHRGSHAGVTDQARGSL